MLVDIGRVIVDDRVRDDSDAIDELAEDIKSNGLLNPISVTFDYHLINGRRRLFACKRLGWEQIEVELYECGHGATNDSIKIANSKYGSGRKWTNNDVRKLLPSYSGSERQPCFICGKHKSITELHHVIQISELTQYLNSGVIDVGDVSTPVVWLCPNCHAYIHAITRGDSDLLYSLATSVERLEHFQKLMDSRISHLRYISTSNDTKG